MIKIQGPHGKNQKLKHINSDSAHSKHCIEATPNRPFKRLAKLTSTNKRIVTDKIDELHPDHAEALKTARLTSQKFPNSMEPLKSIEHRKKRKTIKNQEDRFKIPRETIENQYKSDKK